MAVRFLVAALLVAGALAAAALPAAAQCAMCYKNASAQSTEAQAALNSGILMLLLPPVAILAGILVTAVRRTRP